MLRRLAAELGDAEIVLAGHVSRDGERALSALTSLPNVRHVGLLPPDRVPGFVAGAKVALIPYRDMDYSRAGSPLKLFEYLAAGVPVVSFGIAVGDAHHRPGVYFHAHDHGEFIRECRRLVHEPDDPSSRASRQALAARHDWAPKLERIVGLALGHERPPTPHSAGTEARTGRSADDSLQAQASTRAVPRHG